MGQNESSEKGAKIRHHLHLKHHGKNKDKKKDERDDKKLDDSQINDKNKPTTKNTDAKPVAPVPLDKEEHEKNEDTNKEPEQQPSNENKTPLPPPKKRNSESKIDSSNEKEDAIKPSDEIEHPVEKSEPETLQETESNSDKHTNNAPTIKPMYLNELKDNSIFLKRQTKNETEVQNEEHNRVDKEVTGEEQIVTQYSNS
jgi:hypothetical protein